MKQAIPVHALLYPVIICRNGVMPHPVSLCCKREAHGIDAGDCGTESIEQQGAYVEKPWCEQYMMYRIACKPKIIF